MRITRITKTLLVAVSLVFLPAKASDFGVWTGLGATKKVGMFSFTLDGGFRSQNNLKSVDRWNVGFGVEYKPSAYFSVATSYDFLYNYKCESKEAKYDTWIEKDDDGNEYTEKEYKGYNVKKPYWRCKNRWNFDLTGKLPIGRLTLSLRERYQFTRANSVKSLVDKYRVNSAGDVPEYKKTDVKLRSANNDSRLRSRLMADYDIRHCPLSPYAYIEIANNLCSGMQLEKTRVGVGTEIKINKQNKLDVGYVYQDSRDDDFSGSEHVIDISYKYKF